MNVLLPLSAAAALMFVANAANAATYSISVVGSCDHLTVTVEGGIVSGQSDASSCDTSAVVGTGKTKKFAAAGDLGYGSTEAWTWSFALGKGGTGTGTLIGYAGSGVYGPSTFDVTYTTGATAGVHQNNGLPPITARFRK